MFDEGEKDENKETNHWFFFFFCPSIPDLIAEETQSEFKESSHFLLNFDVLQTLENIKIIIYLVAFMVTLD